MSLNSKYKKEIEILRRGGVGVMPTDTIYGLVGSAFSKRAVKRVYKIKKRNKNKKLIVLISSIKDLEKFKIKIDSKTKKTLSKFWPGKVSIVISNVAFRFPKNKYLIKILKKTGPLVASSANPEGFKHAENIKQAQAYFGNDVDFYITGGTLKSKPSALIRINKKGEIEVLRGIIKKHGK